MPNKERVRKVNFFGPISKKFDINLKRLELGSRFAKDLNSRISLSKAGAGTIPNIKLAKLTEGCSPKLIKSLRCNVRNISVKR